MIAKLVEPYCGKNWSLQFFDLPEGCYTSVPLRANIWYWSRHFGEWYGSRPFLQGDSGTWMMIEFWTESQNLILETCIAICKKLDLELNF